MSMTSMNLVQLGQTGRKLKQLQLILSFLYEKQFPEYYLSTHS